MRYILIVDDKSWWDGPLTDAIRNGHLSDCTVLRATTYREAIDLIEKNRFEIAFLDFSLGAPDHGDAGNGIDVAQALRAHQAEVPIFLVTVKRDHEVKHLCEPLAIKVIEKRRSDLSETILRESCDALANYKSSTDILGP